MLAEGAGRRSVTAAMPDFSARANRTADGACRVRSTHKGDRRMRRASHPASLQSRGASRAGLRRRRCRGRRSRCGRSGRFRGRGCRSSRSRCRSRFRRLGGLCRLRGLGSRRCRSRGRRGLLDRCRRRRRNVRARLPPEIGNHQNDDYDDDPDPSILALHVVLRGACCTDSRNLTSNRPIPRRGNDGLRFDGSRNLLHRG